jgi:CRP/FNR family transcriptional regulator, cyclic AMP receptor protein
MWAEPDSFASTLTEDAVADLKRRGRARSYRRGTPLFHEGDDSTHVLLLTRGRVKISCATEDGKEVVLAVRGPGDLVGEMSVFDDEPRSASGFAMEDVETIVVPHGDFQGFLKAHAEAAITLLRMQTARLRDADRKRVEFLAQDSIGRVAARLVEMCDRYGETNEQGFRISLPLSQDELAGWTGASREAVSKALQYMRGKGWIETHRRGVTVVDLGALERRAG